MTSNFPGTVAMQHGWETDKLAGTRVEDKRSARSNGARRACPPSHHQQAQAPRGRHGRPPSQQGGGHFARTWEYGHFLQAREECGSLYR